MPRRGRTPLPPETPGFGLRVAISILVVFGWLIFLVLWFLFYAQNFGLTQNLAVVFASLLVGIAILAASWVSWGINYGYKYRNEWRGERREYMYRHGPTGMIYGLGFVGALVYYITTAPSFWVAVLGVFKAIVWPAFLVYGALKFLGL